VALIGMGVIGISGFVVLLLFMRGCANSTAKDAPTLQQPATPAPQEPQAQAPTPTPLPSQPGEINDPSYFTKPEAIDKPVQPLFDAKNIIGLSESDLPKILGRRTKRAGSSATFKPKGCDEVTVTLAEGRAVAVRIYFSEGAAGPSEALQRVGIFPSTPAEQTTPEGAIWSGATFGLEAATVGAFSNMGSAGGWDCVGIK
jgi:hypothetical protein